jgi:microcystin-dependent protein
MAGTIFGLPLSIQFDEAGRPASGGLLYTYAASTSTPANTYADFALSSLNSWPLQLDAAGRVPSFYVDDGAYRSRLTTSGGVELFDEQSITAIGASSGSSGESASADTSTLLQTGDIIFNLTTDTKSGFVKLNGTTIGSGSSGATQRANADTQSLFEYFWNALADAQATVSSGRGANATADFNANKTITLPDFRARAPFGLDDMGTSAASRIAAGTPTTVGTASGAETVTISANNLPTHTHAAGSYAVGTTITNGTTVVRTSSFTNNVTTSGGQNDVPIDANDSTLSLASGAVSGSSGNNTTTATATNKMPPYILGTWFCKL